jgi:hypothetical protein
MECWASCLGNCGGGFSREHYISDGILDGRVVNAFGLEWCKDAPKSIGVANATAKILCKTHNEALSEFDTEAVKLSRFLTANVWDDPLKSDSITLSGVLLEKWALKTCVNLGFIGALDPEMHTRVIPDETLVRAVFCPGLPPEGMGLYFLHGKISNEGYQVGLSWKAIRNRASGDRIVGMSFVFNGFRFVVSLVPVRAEPLLLKMGVIDGFDFALAKIDYRPRNIRLRSESAGEKVIHLTW